MVQPELEQMKRLFEEENFEKLLKMIKEVKKVFSEDCYGRAMYDFERYVKWLKKIRKTVTINQLIFPKEYKDGHCACSFPGCNCQTELTAGNNTCIFCLNGKHYFERITGQLTDKKSIDKFLMFIGEREDLIRDGIIEILEEQGKGKDSISEANTIMEDFLRDCHDITERITMKSGETYIGRFYSIPTDVMEWHDINYQFGITSEPCMAVSRDINEASKILRKVLLERYPEDKRAEYAYVGDPITVGTVYLIAESALEVMKD